MEIEEIGALKVANLFCFCQFGDGDRENNAMNSSKGQIL